MERVSEDLEIKIDLSSSHKIDELAGRALFSFSPEILNKVVVLFKFYRKFAGELTEQLNEFYAQKPDKVKNSEVKKFNSKYEKLTSYKNVQESFSIFAWSAYHIKDLLSKDKISVADKIYLIPTKVNTGDTTLLKAFFESKNNLEDKDKSYTKKPINGRMVIELEQITDLPPIPRHFHPNSHQLIVKQNNSHLKVNYIPNLESKSKSKLIPLCSDLIIYPKKLTLGKKEYKNIKVKVSFRCSRDRSNLNVFYKKFSKNPNEEKRVPHRYTTISTGNRNPEFNDEIKMVVPCDLTGQYGLVFEFYNILHKESNIQKNHKEDSQLIAYSNLILLGTSTIVYGNQKMKLTVKKPDPTNPSNFKYEDLEGASFEAFIIPKTIAFPTDKILYEFFLSIDEFKRNENKPKKGNDGTVGTTFFEELGRKIYGAYHDRTRGNVEDVANSIGVP
jgi:hypothetical protein